MSGSDIQNRKKERFFTLSQVTQSFQNFLPIRLSEFWLDDLTWIVYRVMGLWICFYTGNSGSTKVIIEDYPSKNTFPFGRKKFHTLKKSLNHSPHKKFWCSMPHDSPHFYDYFCARCVANRTILTNTNSMKYKQHLWENLIMGGLPKFLKGKKENWSSVSFVAWMESVVAWPEWQWDTHSHLGRSKIKTKREPESSGLGLGKILVSKSLSWV